MPAIRFGRTSMDWVVERFDVVGSTMDIADERARSRAPAGLVIVANQQTRGRGQRGRRWTTPHGSSLLMTVVARPKCHPSELPAIPEAIGRHIANAIERVAGVRCSIKPPNDVLVGSRKLAGILCQSSVEAESVRYVLIGIGINANIAPGDLPLPTATSLQCETGRTFEIDLVLNEVLSELAGSSVFRSAPGDGATEHAASRYA